MEISPDNIILVAAILIFISIIVSRASSKFGIPTLLIFLIVGMLFGSDGLGVQFYNAELAQFIGMIALSIILFSGGMDTKLKEIKPIMYQG
ncbi:MAG: cation:proton antiporter, partial [Bacteroidales bacterium]|nr:cation:proton antiporter [Bacteroidales bacterium]